MSTLMKTLAAVLAALSLSSAVSAADPQAESSDSFYARHTGGVTPQ